LRSVISTGECASRNGHPHRHVHRSKPREHGSIPATRHTILHRNIALFRQRYIELARLIRWIYEEKPLRLAMGGAASRQVMANCGWDENAAKTRELLENTLQRLSEN
jgi:hypothetical protein